MGRIAIDTREVRSLGRMLEATGQDLTRTAARVQDRHQATQLNTARDPRVGAIAPGVNLVEYKLNQAAREYNRLGELATRSAREMEAADRLDLKPSLGPAGTKQPGWFPLPGLGNVPFVPFDVSDWPQIAAEETSGWSDWFGDKLSAGNAALDRARGGLNQFTGTVTGVGNRFVSGARGLLGRAGNFASNVRDQVGDKVDGVRDTLSDGVGWVTGGLSSAWNWGKDKLKTLITETWNSIWDGLTTTFNAAIDGINTLGAAAVFAGIIALDAVRRFGGAILEKAIFHTSRDGRSDRQSREHQRSDDRRGRDQGGDGSNGNFNHDWAGRSILDRYLSGGGDWNITDDPEWTEYMMANASLEAQLDQYAQQDLATFIASGEDELTVTETTSVTIENGEGIVGYQYLHGTNGNVGGFERTNHFRRRADGTVEVTSTYTWNDIIDPNPQYSTDRWKSRVAEIITLGQADAYEIHITWTEVQVFDEMGN